VRCPQCGRRIFWEAVTSREASDWVGGAVMIGERHVCAAAGQPPENNKMQTRHD
jgi:DNA-directed RNA polymerase subunit RPC12/RpoP